MVNGCVLCEVWHASYILRSSYPGYHGNQCCCVLCKYTLRQRKQFYIEHVTQRNQKAELQRWDWNLDCYDNIIRTEQKGRGVTRKYLSPSDDGLPGVFSVRYAITKKKQLSIDRGSQDCRKWLKEGSDVRYYDIKKRDWLMLLARYGVNFQDVYCLKI